ncbi:MAG: ABC transporter permease [Acidobacteriota bacterium]|nr:MAG: ABC transporter permease [Acidobacteriota bacterium]
MSAFRQDIRYGLRMLIKNPGFTIVAVITLALGIGANSAIFSVLNAVLLKPLPYDRPEMLLAFRSNESAPDVADIRAWSRSYAEIGGLVTQPLDYTGGGQPRQIPVGHVTGGYFGTLGVRASLGRTLAYADDKPGAPMVAVLSDEMWQQVYNRDPNVLGRSLELSGNAYTVVGVMPAGFNSPREKIMLWVAVNVSNSVAAAYRGVHFLRTYARLKDGVTLRQAADEMQLLDKRLADAYPAENRNRRRVLEPLLDRVVGDTSTTLWVLFGAVCLVLFIACANFANLLLARGVSRYQEMTIRAALGAGRLRLIRLILTESVILSLVGGVVGLILAQWGIEALLALKPQELPRMDAIGLDMRVLGFTLLLSILTGLVFGLVPAWSASHINLNAALKEGERGGSGTVRHRLRSWLVVIEMAMALILLIGAGLLIRSFWELRTVDPGFKTDNLVTMRIELPEKRYKEIPKQDQYRQALLTEVNSLPRVQAALISELPLSGDYLNHDFTREGWNLAAGDEPSAETRSIQGDYFKTMGIPLLAGRDFNAQDNGSSPLVGIVNETLVKAWFKNEDPIGKRVRWARDEQINWITIVGVVADVRHFGLDLPDAPAVYSPYTQSGREWKRWMVLVARGKDSPANLTSTVQKAVWKIDPQLPITKEGTVKEVISESYAERRFNMLLLTIFASLAMVLAGIGIYGVMSYTVAHRTHEIGIRMALGAQLRDVMRLVLADGAKLALLSIGIGLIGAYAVTRTIRSLLFGVSTTDTATFALVSLVLLGVAFLACWIPARRAARVDPMIALRYE